jgi:hypothetical protein
LGLTGLRFGGMVSSLNLYHLGSTTMKASGLFPKHGSDLVDGFLLGNYVLMNLMG